MRKTKFIFNEIDKSVFEKASEWDTTMQDTMEEYEMSKDEYLITDKPLKALTVFAMPMILGSFNLIFYSSAEDAVFKALGVE